MINPLENQENELDLKVEKGTWIAARCFAAQIKVCPYYFLISITVKTVFNNPETFDDYFVIKQKYLDELETEWSNPRHRVDKRAGDREPSTKKNPKHEKKIKLKH